MVLLGFAGPQQIKTHNDMIPQWISRSFSGTHQPLEPQPLEPLQPRAPENGQWMGDDGWSLSWGRIPNIFQLESGS